MVKKLTTGGSRPSEGLSKETGLFNLFLVSQFKVKDLDLEYFLSRSPDFIIYRFFSFKIPRLTIQGQGQGFGLRIFSVKIPRL